MKQSNKLSALLISFPHNKLQQYHLCPPTLSLTIITKRAILKYPSGFRRERFCMGVYYMLKKIMEFNLETCIVSSILKKQYNIMKTK